jgi:polyphenol oxidase
MRGSSYKENPFLRSPLLSAHAELLHLFSTKSFGLNCLNAEEHQHFQVLNSERKHLLKTVLETEFNLKTTIALWPRQTHGKQIGIVNQHNINEDFEATDALITSMRGVFIGVKTADCVPVLLYDTETKTIAAVHSGWRGTVQNITGETLRTMHNHFGTQPKHVRAAIGPCIGAGNYEVGTEVVAQFEKLFSPKQLNELVEPLGNGKALLNLKAAIELQISAMGVPVSQIERSSECTFSADQLFYSARRDGAATGRMINGLMLLP